MPILDGFEATRLIRQFERQKFYEDTPIKIIGLTGYCSQEVKQQCLESGMNTMLPKPSSIEDIRAALTEISLI